MSNSKKILIAALAVIFLAGATPLAAEYWMGNGEEIPWEEPGGLIVYPWLEWSGTLVDGVFSGKWEDPTSGDGEIPPDTVFRVFSGSIIYFYTPYEGGPTFAHCEGEWNIAYLNRMLICGPFSMEFNITDGTCEGSWESFDGFCGTMWGWRIGD